jgi:hypothetical protein
MMPDFRREAGKRPSNPRELNQRKEGWLLRFRKKMKETHDQIMSLPAHYRYLAIEKDSFDMVMGEMGPVVYPPDGIGRIGIISITDRGEDLPIAEISITPERFRVDPGKLRNIESRLLDKVRPDIEVRI